MRSDSRALTLDGRTQTLAEWARERNLPANTIRGRLANGWSVERALGEKCRSGPAGELITARGKTQTIRQWSQELGVSAQSLRVRMSKGLTPDEAMVAHRVAVGSGPEAWEGALDMPWEEDDRAWAMVALYGRMTHRQIGTLMGIVRQRVQQIEAGAFAKLGIDPGAPNLRELLRERLAEGGEREQTWPDWNMGATG